MIEKICEEKFAGNALFRENIIRLLSEYLFTDSDFIKERYARMEDRSCNDEESFMGKASSCLNDDWKKLFECTNFGHDLPVWINAKNSERKVMFISQDPLRSGYEEKGVLLLSSPWGMHSTDFCSGKKVGKSNSNQNARRISIFFEQLQKRNCSIYVTDFNKFYARNTDNKKVKFDKEKIDIFKQIIKREFEIVKPDYVYFIGRLPEKNCKGLFNGRTKYIKHPNAHGLKKEYYEESLSKEITADLGL